MTYMRRMLAGAVGFLLLSACALDTVEGLRTYLGKWLFLGQETHFISKASCTVAVFELQSNTLRSTTPKRAENLRDALLGIKRGQAVWFDIPGMTPHQISEGIMSLDLPIGLGLTASAIGPARDCIRGPSITNGFRAVITSEEAVTLYDPAQNALILLYPPEGLVLFMRGNV